MRKPNAILVVGPNHCGKTTFVEFLALLLDSKRASQAIETVDMSDVIRWGKNLPTAVGDNVRKHIGMMTAGQFLPDCVIVPLFQTWLEHLRANNPRVSLINGSGLPRSINQLALLQLFHASTVVHIEVTRKEAEAALAKRLAETPREKLRSDDLGGPAVFDQRWQDYTNFTIPAIKQLGGRAVTVKRSDPMEMRLRHTLGHILSQSNPPLDQISIRQALRAFRVPDHPVSRKIRQLEQPKQSAAGLRPGSPVFGVPAMA